MDKDKLIPIQINNKIYEYPTDTTLEAVAKDFQKNFPHQIIVARVNGKLKELTNTIEPNSSVEFITTGEKIGDQSYKRTATLVLTKAVSNILGPKAELVVQFSMHKGYYCEIMNHMPVDVLDLERIKQKMKDIVADDIPIKKHNVRSPEAAKIFEAHGMEEKAKLLKFRRASHVNMYQLDDVVDYYYGYMAPSTGYIQRFDLIPYHDGFVLQMPASENPEDSLENECYTAVQWRIFHHG